jgi:hypothetical protein
MIIENQWYRAATIPGLVMFTCVKCGGVVGESGNNHRSVGTTNRETHEKWHENHEIQASNGMRLEQAID